LLIFQISDLDPLTYSSCVIEITGIHHHDWLVFLPGLVSNCDPPDLCYSPGITAMNYLSWANFLYLFKKKIILGLKWLRSCLASARPCVQTSVLLKNKK
jgi:hypothetical protein